jgi:hypothetical protein
MEEWRYSSNFLDLGTRWRWMVSFTSLPLYPPREEPPVTPCGEEENLVLPGNEPGPFNRIDRRYTD